MGKDRKPVRLQSAHRGCSFLTFSFAGFRGEVSFAVLFSLLLFSAVGAAFEWISLLLFFLDVLLPATVWVGGALSIT